MHTKEELLAFYPPQEERFIGGTDHQQVVASVSRNPDGDIIYVVPGSVKAVIPEAPPR